MPGVFSEGDVVLSRFRGQRRHKFYHGKITESKQVPVVGRNGLVLTRVSVLYDDGQTDVAIKTTYVVHKSLIAGPPAEEEARTKAIPTLDSRESVVAPGANPLTSYYDQTPFQAEEAVIVTSVAPLASVFKGEVGAAVTVESYRVMLEGGNVEYVLVQLVDQGRNLFRIVALDDVDYCDALQDKRLQMGGVFPPGAQLQAQLAKALVRAQAQAKEGGTAGTGVPAVPAKLAQDEGTGAGQGALRGGRGQGGAGQRGQGAEGAGEGGAGEGGAGAADAAALVALVQAEGVDGDVRILSREELLTNTAANTAQDAEATVVIASKRMYLFAAKSSTHDFPPSYKTLGMHVFVSPAIAATNANTPLFGFERIDVASALISNKRTFAYTMCRAVHDGKKVTVLSLLLRHETLLKPKVVVMHATDAGEIEFTCLSKTAANALDYVKSYAYLPEEALLKSVAEYEAERENALRDLRYDAAYGLHRTTSLDITSEGKLKKLLSVEIHQSPLALAAFAEQSEKWKISTHAPVAMPLARSEEQRQRLEQEQQHQQQAQKEQEQRHQQQMRQEAADRAKREKEREKERDKKASAELAKVHDTVAKVQDSMARLERSVTAPSADAIARAVAEHVKKGLTPSFTGSVAGGSSNVMSQEAVDKANAHNIAMATLMQQSQTNALNALVQVAQQTPAALAALGNQSAPRATTSQQLSSAAPRASSDSPRDDYERFLEFEAFKKMTQNR